jgi:hypothetical protein
LNPQAGQRQTACMRYISALHRSQSVLTSALGVLVSADLSGVIVRPVGCAGTFGLPEGEAGPTGLNTEQIMSWLANQRS